MNIPTLSRSHRPRYRLQPYGTDRTKLFCSHKFAPLPLGSPSTAARSSAGQRRSRRSRSPQPGFGLLGGRTGPLDSPSKSVGPVACAERTAAHGSCTSAAAVAADAVTSAWPRGSPRPHGPRFRKIGPALAPAAATGWEVGHAWPMPTQHVLHGFTSLDQIRRLEPSRPRGSADWSRRLRIRAHAGRLIHHTPSFDIHRPLRWCRQARRSCAR